MTPRTRENDLPPTPKSIANRFNSYPIGGKGSALFLVSSFSGSKVLLVPGVFIVRWSHKNEQMTSEGGKKRATADSRLSSCHYLLQDFLTLFLSLEGFKRLLTMLSSCLNQTLSKFDRVTEVNLAGNAGNWLKLWISMLY